MIGISKNIDGTELKVFNNGTIKRKMTYDWKEIKNSANQSKGYNVILINKKQYMRSKIIINAFLKIPLDDKSIYICHKDNDKLNCSFKNLEIKKKMM
uniref:HNH nuclease domain-containing protein n=1 Tax=viral metagenome TaxID=1070528 RepID=A0A6C0D4E4_9ZZZZ